MYFSYTVGHRSVNFTDNRGPSTAKVYDSGFQNVAAEVKECTNGPLLADDRGNFMLIQPILPGDHISIICQEGFYLPYS